MKKGAFAIGLLVALATLAPSVFDLTADYKQDGRLEPAVIVWGVLTLGTLGFLALER